MADKCANCGEALSLEPDANGGYRYYSGEGADASTTCSTGDAVNKAHVLAVKAPAKAKDSDDEGGK